MKANEQTTSGTAPSLSARSTLACSLCAVGSFHLAYAFTQLCWLIAAYLFCLTVLTRQPTNRRAFYVGLAVGLAVFVPQMDFLWTIFGPVAIPLWLVLAFWHGLFLLLGRQCWICLGQTKALLLLPFLWTGLEYFRSELYFLRFSWFNAGYVFSGASFLHGFHLGGYGGGFALMAVAAFVCSYPRKQAWPLGIALSVIFGLLVMAPRDMNPNWPGQRLNVAGIQLEFPAEMDVLIQLDQLIEKHPTTELIVLSEYTFDDPPSLRVKSWCRRNQRYLIVGGKEPAGGREYYNTAYIISPQGEIVFQQAKCMPIQFFNDGLPAREQRVWESPWGKLGICICYDLSFTRVTDELIRQGAQALIVPTMDVSDWGRHQHELHARVAPVRAAEYGVPIFRVCSSGISQIVNLHGVVEASASFPGQGEMIAGTIVFRRPRSGPPHLPFDRLVAPLSTALTAMLAGWFAFASWRNRHANFTPQFPIQNLPS